MYMYLEGVRTYWDSKNGSVTVPGVIIVKDAKAGICMFFQIVTFRDASIIVSRDRKSSRLRDDALVFNASSIY